MNIAEIFYPKELKDIILRLQAEDDLNSIALKVLNRQIIVFIAFFTFMCILFLLFGGIVGLVLTVVLFFFFVVLVNFMTQQHFYKYMAVYILGKKTDGIVKTVSFKNLRFPTKEITVQNTTNGEVIKISPGAVWGRQKSNDSPEVGDSISYYSSDDKNMNAMPASYEVAQIFCLSKSLINLERE